MRCLLGAAALFLTMAPAAAAARQAQAVAYVILGSEDGAAAERLEQLLSDDREIAAALPHRLVPAQLGAAAFGSCDDRRSSHGHLRCVRALLPAGDGGSRVIALFVERIAHSNVTGSRIHYTNAIWCIGARGVGRAEVWDRLTSPSPIALKRVRERFPACVSDAVAAAAGSSAHRIVPVRAERLARDAATARGQAPEQAIVEVLALETPHRDTGQCSLKGRVAHVEGGETLRMDDILQFAAPCRYGGEDAVSAMMSQSGFNTGASARIYLDRRSGELFYMEAL